MSVLVLLIGSACLPWERGTAQNRLRSSTRHLRIPTFLTMGWPPGTRYTYRGVEIYLSPSDQDAAVYLVGARTVGRWPRSDPLTLCL